MLFLWACVEVLVFVPCYSHTTESKLRTNEEHGMVCLWRGNFDCNEECWEQKRTDNVTKLQAWGEREIIMTFLTIRWESLSGLWESWRIRPDHSAKDNMPLILLLQIMWCSSAQDFTVKDSNVVHIRLERHWNAIYVLTFNVCITLEFVFLRIL